MMKETILQKLKEIEEKENVRILHCVESGSRAWGFASPDSDYDVRFIYVRPPEYYLKLEKTRDIIEWQLDDTLDINGWDLQKTLRLLHASNPTLFEWNSSPIVYSTTKEWERVSAVIDGYFVSKTGLLHYLGTAKNNYREFLCGEEVKLKKYFYVLRPVLACRWIIDRGTPPPMLFSELADIYLHGEIKEEVDKLLAAKTDFPEVKTIKRVTALNEYLERAIEQLGETVSAMPAGEKRGYEELDELFVSLVGVKR